MSASELGTRDAARAALEATGDVAYAWDLETDRIEWAGSLGSLGLDADGPPLTGRDFAQRILPEDLARRQNRLAAHLAGESGFFCEYRLRDGQGALNWVEERGGATAERPGRPRQVFGVLREIGQRKFREARILRAANYDELTGHFNRTRLRQLLDQMIAVGDRRGMAVAFLAVGIDDMTGINHRFGRRAADTVLIEIGRRLDRCVSAGDGIGRLGGDRFGVVVPLEPGRGSAEDAGVAAERILETVRSIPIETAAGRISVTASIGSAAFPDHGSTSHQVILRAEAALAGAKEAGRDCHLHQRSAATRHAKPLAAEAVSAAVKKTLSEQRLLFAYQPVICASSGKIDYFECLLRMREANDRILSGEGLVAAAEKGGFIHLLDRYVLETATEELLAHPEIRLGINVSGLTAGDRSWWRELASKLRANPRLAQRLVIEITETAALYDTEETAHFVNALRDLGCRVALDDFGAGQTSLQHLQDLAVDTVKIDRSFVRGLSSNRENQVFFRHLLGLAKGFGFATVAEGVETADDADILRAEGVGYLQGYHIGRPTLERSWRGDDRGAGC